MSLNLPMTNVYLQDAIKIIQDNASPEKSLETKPKEEIVVSMSVL